MTHFMEVCLLIFFAPLAQGLVTRFKAHMQGRSGFSIWQPYHLLVKLLQRQAVWSAESTLVMRLAPFIYLGAVLVASLAVPLFTSYSWGDLLLFIFALALGRFTLALAALDQATAFAGMGSSREMTLGALAEPALLASMLPWILRAGSTAWPAVLAASRGVEPFDVLRVALLLGGMTVLIGEVGRLPVDNPDTHLELTMIHEAMLLEYSGPPLGIILLGSWVKQLMLVAVFSDVLIPWNQPSAFGIAMLWAPVKWLALLAVMALVESYSAKLRFLRLPAYLTTSILFSSAAVLLQFAGVR